jgi:phosphoribosyl-AMP cyclohydrolase / phosphoribosyl-ATP pyrophosphohydrolase
MELNIDFSKSPDGLVPAIIQDANTAKVLMLGYMNAESLTKTKETGLVTFFSRSRREIWTKGETSGNFLKLQEIRVDCDHDTLLVKAIPVGPVCHTGADTCFEEANQTSQDFLLYLENLINDRKLHPVEGSYTNKLFAKGINKVAQKVGEEAVELVIEAKDDNDDLFLNEAADLVYHLFVLLAAKNKRLDQVVDILRERHK